MKTRMTGGGKRGRSITEKEANELEGKGDGTKNRR